MCVKDINGSLVDIITVLFFLPTVFLLARVTQKLILATTTTEAANILISAAKRALYIHIFLVNNAS